MKPEIHPQYRDVIFYDVSSKAKFLTRSTVATDQTIEHEGEEYPMVELDVTSASHPFFTGNQKFVDTEGRIERFMKKYAKK